MSIVQDTRQIPEKYSKYKQDMSELFHNYEINSFRKLLKNYRSNAEFRKEWIALWQKIMNEQSGKLSLTSAGILIGLSIGGIGVAALGTAFGVPSAIILGIGGYLAGSELDQNGVFIKIKNLFNWNKKEDVELDIKPNEMIELIGEIEIKLNDLELQQSKRYQNQVEEIEALRMRINSQYWIILIAFVVILFVSIVTL